MLGLARTVALALLATVGLGVGTAEAQLWKPAKKPTAAATRKPSRAKPARKPARRTARPSRAAVRRALHHDDAPPPPPAAARDRDADRGDDLPEFDDSPSIVVDMPTRGEK